MSKLLHCFTYQKKCIATACLTDDLLKNNHKSDYSPLQIKTNKESKNATYKRLGGSLVVSVLTLSTGDPSSYSAKNFSFSVKFLFTLTKINKIETGVGPILKRMLQSLGRLRTQIATLVSLAQTPILIALDNQHNCHWLVATSEKASSDENNYECSLQRTSIMWLECRL